MYNKINVSQESMFQAGEQGPLKRLKENDAKYMNAIKPYVKERKISKRDSKNLISSSPYQNSKSKSKKHEGSCKKGLEDLVKNSRCLSDVYFELQTLKSEYRVLKDSYCHLKRENEQLTERGIDQHACLLREIDKHRRQSQKNRDKVEFAERQIERIKKECFRLVDSEKFKNKKMEEIIQEKELMIAYLRSQLSALGGESTNHGLFFFQHTAPTPNHQEINALSKISANNSVASSICHVDFDLPKQMGPKISSKSNQVSAIVNRTLMPIRPILKESPEQLSSAKQKNSQVCSQSEESFSFSHDRSENQIEGEGAIFDQPTILTFTKKDIIIFDDADNNDKNSFGNESGQSQEHFDGSNEDKKESSDEKSSEEYNGEDHLPTFENRSRNTQKNKFNKNFSDCGKLKAASEKQKVEVRSKKNRAKHKNTTIKHKSDIINISSIKVRSKPTTKRLQIHTDDERLIGIEAKEREEEEEELLEISSSEIRRKPRIHAHNPKKKPNRKRKSEEAPCSHPKK